MLTLIDIKYLTKYIIYTLHCTLYSIFKTFKVVTFVCKVNIVFLKVVNFHHHNQFTCSVIDKNGFLPSTFFTLSLICNEGKMFIPTCLLFPVERKRIDINAL